MNNILFKTLFGSSVVGGIAYSQQNKIKNFWGPSKPDYEKIRNDIEGILLRDDGYDIFGSISPVLVRLAWHSSGTYDQKTKTGGSNGAGMRFSQELNDGANAGLKLAQEFLEPIKKKHPSISYSDLWILASYVAIEQMGAPRIPFTPGRKDLVDGSKCPPNGRLPDASKEGKQGSVHIRKIFSEQMGFTDREIVVLVGGGHGIGRCHKDRSGYDGPWTNQPISLSNEFFKELLDKEWKPKKWNGPQQYEDPSGKLMMLPADLVFKTDPEFRKWGELYKKDNQQLLQDFTDTFKKLTELGFNKDI